MSVEAYAEQADLTVRDSFIQLAEIICSEERLALQKYGRDLRGWDPLDESLFSTPISLRHVVLEPASVDDIYQVKQATFNILGDDEANITVSRDFSDTMDDDPYAKFIYDQFSDSYFSHRHSFCLGILRGMRVQQLRKKQLIHEQARKQFTLTDRRGVKLS